MIFETYHTSNNKTAISDKRDFFLPPASKGSGKVMFFNLSVCSQDGEGWEVPPVQVLSQRGGRISYPVPIWEGGGTLVK